jgi:hypothetical protein
MRTPFKNSVNITLQKLAIINIIDIMVHLTIIVRQGVVEITDGPAYIINKTRSFGKNLSPIFLSL